MANPRARRTISKEPAPSRLQADLSRRILKYLKDEGAAPGFPLVELSLCARFGVSRTPVRGALKLLATDGVLTIRGARGYALAKPLKGQREEEPENIGVEPREDRRLFGALAEARNRGALADHFTQQEIARRFDAKPAVVLRVLRELGDLGLIERNAGNGWSFRAKDGDNIQDAARARGESYAFRRAIEPAMLLEPGFNLDRKWLTATRAAHRKFRRTWRDEDALEFFELNADFHEQLARCSGNRFLYHSVRRQIQLRRFLHHPGEYVAERVPNTIDQHLEILDALEEGWTDRAAALMRHHLMVSALPKKDVGPDQ